MDFWPWRRPDWSMTMTERQGRRRYTHLYFCAASPWLTL